MSNNTIRLAVYGSPSVEIEGIVSAAEPDPVKPGMLMWLWTDGNWILHPFVNTYCTRHICYEQVLVGHDINSEYASGDKINIMKGRPGDVYWLRSTGVLVDPPNPNTYLTGYPVTSDGTGYIRPFIPFPLTDDSIVGIAQETVVVQDGDFTQLVRVEMS